MLCFSSPEHKVLKVSFCDGPLSVVHCPSVRPCVNNVFKQLLLCNRSLDFDQTSQEWSPTKVVQSVLVGCISRSQGKKKVFKMQFLKIFLSETTRPRAFIFGLYHHLEVFYKSCSNYALVVKIDSAPGVTIFHSAGMIPGWSPTKII